MNIRLEGKRALVCGSSQGIGKAAALELAALGAEVILMARNEGALKKVLKMLDGSKPVQHQYLLADFSNPEQVEEQINGFIDKDNPIHILINNTGGPPGGQAIDASPGAFLNALKSHLICNQLLTKALVPGMRQSGYGRIVNIISTSVKVPIPGLGVSNTVRGAVASWAKTLATELGPDGITVNNVLPGFTSTPRLTEVFSSQAEQKGISLETHVQAMKASVPLKRFADTSETAAAIAFLASPAASYINGINLPVDGGRTPCL